MKIHNTTNNWCFILHENWVIYGHLHPSIYTSCKYCLQEETVFQLTENLKYPDEIIPMDTFYGPISAGIQAFTVFLDIHDLALWIIFNLSHLSAVLVLLVLQKLNSRKPGRNQPHERSESLFCLFSKRKKARERF